MAPPTLTSVRSGWEGTFTIDNRDNGERHKVEKGLPFTGNVQLSTNEVRFSFKGKDPHGADTKDHHVFSLEYNEDDDVLEIKVQSEKNKIRVSGASKVLLNIEEPKSGVLGVILLDHSGKIKFWQNYYDIAKKVSK